MLGRVEPELEAVVGLFINMTVCARTCPVTPPSPSCWTGSPTPAWTCTSIRRCPSTRWSTGWPRCATRAATRCSRWRPSCRATTCPASTYGWPGLRTEPLDQKSVNARFDLSMNFYESSDLLKVGVEYSTDMFDSWRIRSMVGHLQTVLTTVTKSPSLHLSEIELLSEEEQGRPRRTRQGRGGPLRAGAVARRVRRPRRRTTGRAGRRLQGRRDQLRRARSAGRPARQAPAFHRRAAQPGGGGDHRPRHRRLRHHAGRAQGRRGVHHARPRSTRPPAWSS